MPALQIRDLPQGTYDALKWRAEREHRSMAQEATVAIERHLQLVPGEQQMMAIARALMSAPRLLLLDEPLTNLDANLREEMRFEIKEIQKKTGRTILYVTHDQEVALAISDRIAIMTPDSDFCQIADPETVYENPVSVFSFRFLGVADILECHCKDGKTLLDNNVEFIPLPKEYMSLASSPKFIAGFRPMDVEITRAGKGIECKVERCTLLGNIVDYLLSIDGITFRAEAQTEEAVRKDTIFNPGDSCMAEFVDIHWFPDDHEYEEVFV